MFVLGMHRSGTSCLAGSLQQAGLELGEVHEWNPWNRKGNREKQAIVDLNDAVLAASGGSWDRPPRRVRWCEEHRQRAREILGELAVADIAGFKDPRTLLVLEGWRELCPRLEFVGVFRHPTAVAASLARRSGMEREQAFSLWRAYNRRLLALHRRQRFPLVDFDAEGAAYRARVGRVAVALGLDADRVAAQPFYDEALRSADAQAELPLPWSLRRLYGALCRAAQE
jgi:hypothetical protein